MTKPNQDEPTLEVRAFNVLLQGFPRREMLVIQHIFQLSTIRSRRYVPCQIGDELPNMLLLNDELAEGQEPPPPELLQSLAGSGIPILRVGSDRERAKADDFYFARPLSALRLLARMDSLMSDAVTSVSGRTETDLPLAERMIPVSDFSAPCPEDFPGPRPLCRGKPILVVDDSETVRALMKTHLSPCGFAVDYAESGEQALELAARTSYRLVFLDVMLPGVDGFDVCRQIKRKLKSDVPVVMLTSKTSRMDRLRGTLSSADHYLTKPLQRDLLIETLHRYFPSFD